MTYEIYFIIRTYIYHHISNLNRGPICSLLTFAAPPRSPCRGIDSSRFLPFWQRGTGCSYGEATRCGEGGARGLRLRSCWMSCYKSTTMTLQHPFINVTFMTPIFDGYYNTSIKVPPIFWWFTMFTTPIYEFEDRLLLLMANTVTLAI